MNKKIILFFICSLFIIGLLLFIFWDNPSVLNKQPILSNKEYRPLLDSIQLVKKKLRKEKTGHQLLEQKFIEMISTRIFPYWYGTKWDFNGTTEIPHEGKIACGYFVTTTLRDMGVPINRIKMAQCPSEEMIQSLASASNIHHLSGITITEFENRLEKFGKGLYIVGLDNHTGFLLLSSHGNYFIHSSGIFPFQVVKDKLSESPLLIRSKYRVVGKISSDEQFLKNWVAYEKK